MSISLKLFWNAARGDNFTTATTQGESDAASAGYQYVRHEGSLPTPGDGQTVPLKLYWSAARGDNLLCSSDQTQRDALAEGYVYVRDEGVVFRDQAPGTVALKQFYSDDRGDHFATATEAGERSAGDAGYRFVRDEGHVRREAALPAFPLHDADSFHHNGWHMVGEALMTKQGQAMMTLTTSVTNWAFWIHWRRDAFCGGRGQQCPRQLA